MTFILVAGLGFRDVARIGFERSVAQQATNECGHSSDKAGCQSTTADIRSALAAEHAVQLSVWQTVFNFVGLIGLFSTILYARGAWLAARASAEADNQALELNRIALSEQRQAMRPYMVFESGVFRAGIDDFQCLFVEVFFKNTGSVPAFLKGEVIHCWINTLEDGFGSRDFSGGSCKEFDIGIVSPGNLHKMTMGRQYSLARFVVSGSVVVGIRLQYSAFGVSWDEVTWLQANWNNPDDTGPFRPEPPPDDDMLNVLSSIIPSLEDKGLKRGIEP